LFGLFVMVERSQARPMIDLQLMRSGRFIGALLGMFAYAACAQVMMTLPLYLQNGLQLSALGGAGMLPFAVAMLLTPRLGMRLAARLSAAQVFALGLLLVGTGNLACAWAVGAGWIWFFALASLVLGAGAGLLNGDTQKNIMACVPRERTGMASGLSTTTRFGAIVLAIGVSVASWRRVAGSCCARPWPAWRHRRWGRWGRWPRVAAGDLQAALALPEPGLREAAAPLARQAFIGGFKQPCRAQVSQPWYLPWWWACCLLSAAESASGIGGRLGRTAWSAAGAGCWPGHQICNGWLPRSSCWRHSAINS
jgi:MFS family permease